MVRRALPVRTCVGCRGRAPASELLRIVAVGNETDHVSLIPDLTRRRPGRGAYLHADPACLASAKKRHAFGRALRLAGVIDTELVSQAVCAVRMPHGTMTSRRMAPMGATTIHGERPSLTRNRKVGRPT